MTEYIKKLDYKFQDIETARHLAANVIHEMGKFASSKGGLPHATIAEAFLLLFADWCRDHLSNEENKYLMDSAINDFLYSIGMCVRKENRFEEDRDEWEEWEDSKHEYFLKKECNLPWEDYYDRDTDCILGAGPDVYSSYLTPENREASEKAERERFESLTEREQFYEMFEDGYIGDGVRVEDLSFDDDDKFDEKYNNQDLTNEF